MPKGLYLPLCIYVYLPLWFFLSSFFFFEPNFGGQWTDLNQTWAHIHLWLLFEKFGLNSPGNLPPTGWGQKTAFLWTDFELWPNISLQRNMVSTIGKKRVNLQGLSYIPPKKWCWWTLVQKRLRTVGEFLPNPLNFRIRRHCQPYGMVVI